MIPVFVLSFFLWFASQGKAQTLCFEQNRTILDDPFDIPMCTLNSGGDMQALANVVTETSCFCRGGIPTYDSNNDIKCQDGNYECGTLECHRWKRNAEVEMYGPYILNSTLFGCPEAFNFYSQYASNATDDCYARTCKNTATQQCLDNDLVNDCANMSLAFAPFQYPTLTGAYSALATIPIRLTKGPSIDTFRAFKQYVSNALNVPTGETVLLIPEDYMAIVMVTQSIPVDASRKYADVTRMSILSRLMASQSTLNTYIRPATPVGWCTAYANSSTTTLLSNTSTSDCVSSFGKLELKCRNTYCQCLGYDSDVTSCSIPYGSSDVNGACMLDRIRCMQNQAITTLDYAKCKNVTDAVVGSPFLNEYCLHQSCKNDEARFMTEQTIRQACSDLSTSTATTVPSIIPTAAPTDSPTPAPTTDVPTPTSSQTPALTATPTPLTDSPQPTVPTTTPTSQPTSTPSPTALTGAPVPTTSSPPATTSPNTTVGPTTTPPSQNVTVVPTTTPASPSATNVSTSTPTPQTPSPVFPCGTNTSQQPSTPDFTACSAANNRTDFTSRYTSCLSSNCSCYGGTFTNGVCISASGSCNTMNCKIRMFTCLLETFSSDAMLSSSSACSAVRQWFGNASQKQCETSMCSDGLTRSCSTAQYRANCQVFDVVGSAYSASVQGRYVASFAAGNQSLEAFKQSISTKLSLTPSSFLVMSTRQGYYDVVVTNSSSTYYGNAAAIQDTITPTSSSNGSSSSQPIAAYVVIPVVVVILGIVVVVTLKKRHNDRKIKLDTEMQSSKATNGGFLISPSKTSLNQA